MKYLRILTVAFISLLALQACMIDGKDQKSEASTSEDSSTKTILVYGSDTCDHCVDFKDQLDSAGLEYTFYDVEKDQSKGEEMMLKVQRTGFQGYVRFPVVEVDGVVRVAPSFESVERSL